MFYPMPDGVLDCRPEYARSPLYPRLIQGDPNHLMEVLDSLPDLARLGDALWHMEEAARDLAGEIETISNRGARILETLETLHNRLADVRDEFDALS